MNQHRALGGRRRQPCTRLRRRVRGRSRELAHGTGVTRLTRRTEVAAGHVQVPASPSCLVQRSTQGSGATAGGIYSIRHYHLHLIMGLDRDAVSGFRVATSLSVNWSFISRTGDRVQRLQQPDRLSSSPDRLSVEHDRSASSRTNPRSSPLRCS